MRINRLAVTILLVAAITFGAIQLTGMIDDKSKRVTAQEAIKLAIEANKRCEKTQIPLSSIFWNDVVDVCIQPPYLSKAEFERQTGKPAAGYSMLLHDGDLKWWLYYSDGKYLEVSMPSGVASQALAIAPTRCVRAQDASILFECKADIVTYKLRIK